MRKTAAKKEEKESSSVKRKLGKVLKVTYRLTIDKSRLGKKRPHKVVGWLMGRSVGSG